MILNYLGYQRSQLFISAADSDGSDRTRRTRCTRENNLWYPGNLGSISAVSRVQSSMPPEKSSFERMSGGSFSKQRLLIKPIKDKRGRPNGYIQSEREKASVLFTSTVSFTLRAKSSPALDKSFLIVVIFWRYWYQFTVLSILRHLACQSVQHMAICSQYKVNLSAL